MTLHLRLILKQLHSILISVLCLVTLVEKLKLFDGRTHKILGNEARALSADAGLECSEEQEQGGLGAAASLREDMTCHSSDSYLPAHFSLSTRQVTSVLMC